MSDKTDTSGTDSGHVRNASATERLSALLDERGKAHSVWPSGLVVWHDEGSWVYEYSPAKAEGDYWGGILYATLRHCGPEQAVAATLGPENAYTREDVEGAFVDGYSLGSLPVGSDPQWDQNEQTVDEHMAELGWVRKDAATLGEKPPRHRKRSKRPHVRSDHRHEYEQVCIDGHGFEVSHGTKTPLYWVGRRCRVCGRLQDARLMHDLREPPEGMRLFEVEDFILFNIGSELPESYEVRRG